MSTIYVKTATILDMVPSSEDKIYDFACLRVAHGNLSRGDMLGYELNGEIHSLGTIKAIMHRCYKSHVIVNPSTRAQFGGEYLMRMIMDNDKTLHWRNIPAGVNQLMVVLPVKVKCVMKYISEGQNTININNTIGNLEIGDMLSYMVNVDATYFDCIGRVLGTSIARKDIAVDSSKREMCVQFARETNHLPANVKEVVVLEPTKSKCEIFIDEDYIARVKNGVLHVGDILTNKAGNNILSKVLSITAVPPSNPIQSTDEPIRFDIEMKCGSRLLPNQTYVVLE
jgi:hypothetical protein